MPKMIFFKILHRELVTVRLTITDFAVLGIIFKLFTDQKALALLLTTTNAQWQRGRVALFLESSKSGTATFSLAGRTASCGGKLSSLVDK